MQERYVEAFNGVKFFVDDLWFLYGDNSTPSPINLYKRLLSKVDSGDTEVVNKFLNGFKYFLSTYEKQIVEGRLLDIPKGVRVNYGDSKRVYLEIQKYIYKADDTTRLAIKQHLLTISAILDPSKEKLDQLDENKIEDFGIDESTPEGRLFGDIMYQTREAMNGVDSSNPTIALMTLMKSGVISNMVNTLQNKAESGEIDIQSLIGTMQTAMGSAMNTEQLAVEDMDDEDSEDVLFKSGEFTPVTQTQPEPSSVCEEKLDFSNFDSPE